MIWAGNMQWKIPDKYKPHADRNKNWREAGWPLLSKQLEFPYAGIHNGNGDLIYPGPTPSIRLKILRDGLEDFGYFSILKELSKKSRNKKFKQEAEKLLSVSPDVLMDAHYFNRNPEALLKVRNQIAELIEREL